MYERGTHRVIDSDECLLENREAKRIILTIRDLMRRFRIEPYDEDTDEGFLRHVQVRVGHTSGEIMVTVVTREDQFPGAKGFVRALREKHPTITTVVQNVNTRQTNVILGDKERTLFGPGFILDELCGLSFRISSKSFYQVNSTQTEVLYRRAIGMAKLAGTEVLMDAYCGTGTIGLVAARGVDGNPGAARVIGVEERPDAVGRRPQQRAPQRHQARRIRCGRRGRIHAPHGRRGGAARRAYDGSASCGFHAGIPEGCVRTCAQTHRLHFVQPSNAGARRGVSR